MDNTASLTVGRGIRITAARAPTKAALHCDGVALTYAELSARISRVAQAALASRLGPGTNVTLLAPNCLEYIEIVAGLSDVGIVVVTANAHMTSVELNAILADSDSRALFVHPACADVAASSDASIRGPVLSIGSSYDQWRDKDHDALPLPMVADDSTFAISYTSGTTGKPKGIMLSHRSRILTFLGMAAEYGCYGPEDHGLAVAPLYHGGGFAFGVAPLFSGGCCTILSSFDPEQLLSELEATCATSVFVVPTHVSALFSLPDSTRARYRYPHLKTVISNAAPLPQSAKEQLVAYFGEGRLFECYGSTEACIVSNIRPGDVLRKRDSVGLPFPLTEIAILGDDGCPVAAGDKGVVYSRSPYLFNGYWNHPEETAAAWHEDWVTAGDLGRQDEEGFLYIEGRAKDMIISGGVNIYPKEVETVLERLPGVTEAVVVGAPDAHWGERVVAFVVGKGDIDIVALEAHCRAELSNFKVPKEYRIVDSVPRNPTGKLLRRVLRDEID